MDQDFLDRQYCESSISQEKMSFLENTLSRE